MALLGTCIVINPILLTCLGITLWTSYIYPHPPIYPQPPAHPHHPPHPYPHPRLQPHPTPPNHPVMISFDQQAMIWMIDIERSFEVNTCVCTMRSVGPVLINSVSNLYIGHLTVYLQSSGARQKQFSISTKHALDIPCSESLLIGFNQVWCSIVAHLSLLTHWGWDKMEAISQKTLSNAFSLMKILEFRLKIHWSLFLRVQVMILQHWFR